MAYIIGSVPYFHCYVRREYTVNLTARHGEYVPAVAYGVRCVRGSSLWFQCMLMEPEDKSAPNDTAGASFMLPIEALCHQPCEKPDGMDLIQPWDVFSSDFGVDELDFVRRSAVYVLPSRIPGLYRFTLDFVGSDLAEDPGQHKSLHIVFMEGGLIGAFPNNRLLWRDDAFWNVMDQKPDFISLAPEFRAEGHQSIMLPPARKANGVMETV